MMRRSRRIRLGRRSLTGVGVEGGGGRGAEVEVGAASGAEGEGGVGGGFRKRLQKRRERMQGCGFGRPSRQSQRAWNTALPKAVSKRFTIEVAGMRKLSGYGA